MGAPFEPKGCDSEHFEYTPLSELKVHWTYKKGDRLIEMGYMNVEVLRYSILATMKERNEDVLTKYTFLDLWQQQEDREGDHDKDKLSEEPFKIFHQLLDTERKGFLTKQDILTITHENLKKVARLLDPPHGPVVKEEEENSLNEDTGSHEEL